METYSAWEWMRRRFEYGLGQRVNDSSGVIPAPVWFEEGDHPGARMHWYGLVVTYPRRPTLGQLGGVPPGVRAIVGFADDLASIRNPDDLVHATDRLWVYALRSFARGQGGAVVMPSFFGADP